MNRIVLFLLCVCAISSCVERYPTNFTKELPFGFEYNMAKSKAYSIVDSLSEAGIIKVYDDKSEFWYDFEYEKENISLMVSLFFYKDYLCKIDVRSNSYLLYDMEDKETYNLAIQFLKSQEINLTSYEKTQNYLSDKYEYDYKKYPYTISLMNGLTILFCDQQIQHLVDKEEKQITLALKENGDEFCKSVMDVSTGIYKAAITDAGFLVIGVKPMGKPNFDYLAQSYLEKAYDDGLHIKGCFVVDINKSTWKKGAVIGERIGEAYK